MIFFQNWKQIYSYKSTGSIVPLVPVLTVGLLIFFRKPSILWQGSRCLHIEMLSTSPRSFSWHHWICSRNHHHRNEFWNRQPSEYFYEILSKLSFLFSMYNKHMKWVMLFLFIHQLFEVCLKPTLNIGCGLFFKRTSTWQGFSITGSFVTRKSNDLRVLRVKSIPAQFYATHCKIPAAGTLAPLAPVLTKVLYIIPTLNLEVSLTLHSESSKNV